MNGDLNEVASHCPACGAEYRPGFDICADDGTPLVPGPAPEDIGQPVTASTEEPAQGPWEPVAEFSATHEAALLAGRLEAEGIPARIFPDGQSEYYGPGTSAILGQPIKVLVQAHRVMEARQVLTELNQPDPS